MKYRSNDQESYAKLEPSGDRSEYYNQEDADLRPEELSGDQNGEQSIFTSTVGGHKSNFLLTSITIAKTVIGSAILSIPYVVKQMGYVFAIIMFGVAMALNQFGTVLLLKAKNLSKHSNYATIFYEIWPSRMAKGLGSILIFLNNIGICIAELIIFKSTIRNILTDVISDTEVLYSFYTQAWFMVLLVSFVEIPFVLVSKIEKLKFLALGGVVGIIIFMVVFVIFFMVAVADQNPDNNPVGNMRMFPDNWLLAAATVPNILLALSYQMNFFPIFKGMQKVTDKKMIKAVTLGLTFCLFCYLLVGLLAYAYVGQQIGPNFLQYLDYNKVALPFYILINFSFLASLYFAFPIMFFGGRNNFIALAKLVLSKKGEGKPAGNRANNEVDQISSFISPQKTIEQRRKTARIYFLVYTLGLFAFTIGIAMGVDDIQVVFNAVGAICATSIGLLLPTYFYMRLTKIKNQPIGIKYYMSAVVFAVMAPYALFSMIALHLAQ